MNPFTDAAALPADTSSTSPPSRVTKTSPKSSTSPTPPPNLANAPKREFPRKQTAPRTSMTLNACTACRRRRTKCDGQSPCGTCSRAPGVRAHITCVYESTARTAKKHLLRENDELRRQNTLSDQILDALRSNYHVSDILQLLRDQESLAIIAKIANLPSSAEPSVGSPSGASSISEGLGSDGERLLQNDVESAEDHRRSPSTAAVGPSETQCPWMAAPCDQQLVKHLFILYWTWIHPTYHFFNIEQLIQHYETGSSEHCSAFLVAAVCAAACDHLGPLWMNVSGKVPDVATLKQDFIAEAVLQESLADRSSRTWLEASQVMLAMESPVEPSGLTPAPGLLPVDGE